MPNWGTCPSNASLTLPQVRRGDRRESGCAAKGLPAGRQRKCVARTTTRPCCCYSKALASRIRATRPVRHGAGAGQAQVRPSTSKKGTALLRNRSQWESGDRRVSADAAAECRRTSTPHNELHKAVRETASRFRRAVGDRAAQGTGAPRCRSAEARSAVSNIPILLNFQDIEVGKIFEAISKASGINFIFDEKVDLEKPMTIDMGNVTLEKALDILMLQTKNFYKVIDEYTLARRPRHAAEAPGVRGSGDPHVLPQQRRDEDRGDLVLRSLLQSRQIAENADLNSVTIKDTPAKVAIAERIINANDKSKGEVVIEVELLEINRTVAKTVGIDLSSKTLSLTFRDGQASLPLNNLRRAAQAQAHWTVGVIPSVILNFLQERLEHQVDRQAAVARRRGRAGRDPHRRPRADPDHVVQYLADDRRQHRADHLVHLPERGYHGADRAPRAPQQGGHAQGPGRDQSGHRRSVETVGGPGSSRSSARGRSRR